MLRTIIINSFIYIETHNSKSSIKNGVSKYVFDPQFQKCLTMEDFSDSHIQNKYRKNSNNRPASC